VAFVFEMCHPPWIRSTMVSLLACMVNNVICRRHLWLILSPYQICFHSITIQTWDMLIILVIWSRLNDHDLNFIINFDEQFHYIWHSLEWEWCTVYRFKASFKRIWFKSGYENQQGNYSIFFSLIQRVTVVFYGRDYIVLLLIICFSLSGRVKAR
jgi:hypothetical protein